MSGPASPAICLGHVPYIPKCFEKQPSSMCDSILHFVSNHPKRGGTHLECVQNNYAKFQTYQVKGVKIFRLQKLGTLYTQICHNSLSSMHDKFDIFLSKHHKRGDAHLQCVQNNFSKFQKCWNKVSELQITQTWYPKVWWTDGWTYPTLRPAFTFGNAGKNFNMSLTFNAPNNHFIVKKDEQIRTKILIRLKQNIVLFPVTWLKKIGLVGRLNHFILY